MCTERKATGEYVLACCLFATMKFLLFAHKIVYSMEWSFGVESNFGVAKVLALCS